MGRKGVWGGWEPGADGSMGREGAWGGSESGAEGSMGRKGVWGGWEPGAEGSMGRKGVWGGREPVFGQCIHVDAEQLASAAPSHSTSADTHPRTPTGTRVRVPSHACALPRTQAHAHYRSSTLTLKLRHFSARREASTLYYYIILKIILYYK